MTKIVHDLENPVLERIHGLRLPSVDLDAGNGQA